ncbi:MAG: carboxypeptidase-like regulatory domain-containing protein, partial [Bacteroidota bacterium]|nr:carboxypeptidase-like regulatory domain-containing protein [Bacteroidota bacterium]
MDLKFILPVLFLLSFSTLMSQTVTKGSVQFKISRVVLDSATQQPIEYATISLFEDGSKKAVFGSISDVHGKFSLDVTKTGVFNILVESIGYLPYSINTVALDERHTKNIGKIYLNKKNTQLQSVTVVGSQKLIENKIDKMVFNAEKDLTSQGGVATDILKKIPQVSVD